MTHDKLLKYINDYVTFVELNDMPATAKVIKSLSAVVELHKQVEFPSIVGKSYLVCEYCTKLVSNPMEICLYPCQTIKVIEKELQ